MGKVLLPVIGRAIRNVHDPEKARAEFDHAINNYLNTAIIPPAQNKFDRLANIVVFIQDRIGHVFQFLLPRFISIFAPALASLNLLARLTEQSDAGDHGFSMLILEITRGLPENVTTEMDLALWKTAQTIKADSESLDLFTTSDASTLARRYLEGTLPVAAQNVVRRFLDQYGMRGIGEIDFGQPRWREDPTSVIQSLQSYLQIGEEAAPDILFARGEQAAHAAIEKLALEARHQPGGWLKEKNDSRRGAASPCADGSARKPEVLRGPCNGNCAQGVSRV